MGQSWRIRTAIGNRGERIGQRDTRFFMCTRIRCGARRPDKEPRVIAPGNVDRTVEEAALRRYGLIGRGGEMGNSLFAIDIASLPAEARRTIDLIASGGPFPYPQHDGHPFSNRFGDLPSRGEYLEFTVPTPGISNRGKRRIVARRSGVLFFTACHYERVQGPMPKADRIEATLQLDAAWRNGFYVVTGMTLALRNRLAASLAHIH